MDDYLVLERIKKKDENALEEIMQQYNKLLWVIVGGVLGKIGTPEDIEECVSDVYVRLWENPDKFDPSKGNLKVYLAIMSKSMALNMYAKLAKIKTTELDEDISGDGDFIEEIFTKDMSRRIFISIIAMNEPDKEILIRRLFLDQKPATIAEELGLPVKEVENRLYQKKRKLRKLLGGDWL